MESVLRVVSPSSLLLSYVPRSYRSKRSLMGRLSATEDVDRSLLAGRLASYRLAMPTAMIGASAVAWGAL